MELIERYLQEIGRRLPAGKRKDILAELRSTLEDSLETENGTAPSEAAVVEAIRKMGSPQQVAAGYVPDQQYLIGPELFPLFRLVLGIVFSAVIGAQLLAVLLSLLFNGGGFEWIDSLFGIVGSLPAALGSVVIVFYVLQTQSVRPELEEKPFDPRELPALDRSKPVSRFEQVVSILFGVVFLVIFAAYAREGGFGWLAGLGIFENPVLARYFPWIAVSFLAGIVMDIVLLWRGRWSTGIRIAHIAVNLFSLGVLGVLIRGHDAWLVEAGYQGSYFAVAELPEILNDGVQLFGMIAFRFGLAIAALVVAFETLSFIYHLGREARK